MIDALALTDDELALACGGTHHRHHAHHDAAPASSSWNPFGFLGSMYKGFVFDYASHVGGAKMAQAMYGSHATARDQARAQAAMKQFLVGGNKLPKGAPHLFGA